jgi:hypothetical protein
MLHWISGSTPAKPLVRPMSRWQNFALMNAGATFLAISSFVLCTGSAQTPAPDAAKLPEAAQLEALAKKIEEQNAKIDALSQEILKLEQQLSHVRPGVMIGEGAPAPATAAAPASAPVHPSVAGNTHTVARGETLTSKMVVNCRRAKPLLSRHLRRPLPPHHRLNRQILTSGEPKVVSPQT